jgi:hypothetical protein
LRHQLHDFNPGITPNGVFWIVQVPDSAVQITADSLTINLQDVAVVDQFHFPGGTGHVPTTVSFNATYTKSGTPRKVRPTSHDPLSPFHWAGEMWKAKNSGTFSVAYNNGRFSAEGSFSSSGNFGEMGTERNGSFVGHEEDDVDAELGPLGREQSGIEGTQVSGNGNAELRQNSPSLKGRIPLTGLTFATAPAENR